MLRLKFLLFLCFLTAAGYGQTLEEFMQRALEENYQLHITRLEADIAGNNNTIGNAGFLPTIDITGQYQYSWSTTRQNFFNGDEREGDNARNTGLNGAIAVNQTLFDGFRMFASKDQLSLLEEMGRVNARFFIDQTLADIATLYFQLIKEREILNYLRQSIRVSAYRERLEERRELIGAGTGLDYYQAAVAYQNDSSAIVSQKSIIRSLEIELNRIVNRNLDTPVMPSSDSLDITPHGFSREEFMLLLKERNNTLRLAQLDELIAETEVRIQRAELSPVLSAFGGYTYNRSTSEIGFVESNRSYGPNIGVAVRFNLFNGGNNRREVRNAEIQQTIATESREQTDLSLDAELYDAYARYEFVLEQIMIARENVETANRAQFIAEAQLREGAINGIDFRVNQVTLINAETNLAQLKFTLKALEVNLYRLTSQVMDNYL